MVREGVGEGVMVTEGVGEGVMVTEWVGGRGDGNRGVG